MDAVLLEQVCKSFGQVAAVDGLSARIPAGSVYGFLGPNGAGKTTTLRMIMNIIRPDRGQIGIFGAPAGRRVNDRIGYMPEERGLYRKMTASKVLAYFGAIKGLTGSGLARSVCYWLERVGLEQWADKKVEELSRGMHQKLQFAVTAVTDPALLILDEPFSGLDPLNLDLLKNIIMEMRSQGKTVIFSTHVMHEAERLCDFILLINKGRAVIDGRLEDIRSQHRSRTVSVELEGRTDFVEALPMVVGVVRQGRRLEIALTPDGDAQDLLKALVVRVRIQAFEVKVPSLHEIFVKLVGTDDAPDA
ncbi:MAG: ABC transporter ATP-binding protein [Planctomycetota bacterium]|jgi:ABC-2 type transport system ATP-binding protein